jgi:hypothetical protein
LDSLTAGLGASAQRSETFLTQVGRDLRACGSIFMNNHERFHVVYDGPALVEHRMDVRDLAPALVAIADLFSAANQD